MHTHEHGRIAAGHRGGPDEVDPEANGVHRSPTTAPTSTAPRVSAEELRAEVERLSNEERQHVDDLREEVGDSVAELAARFDVKARVAERKDEAVATVHQQVDRARHVAVGPGGVRRRTPPRQKPGLVAGRRGGPAGAARRRPAAPPGVTPERGGLPASVTG